MITLFKAVPSEWGPGKVHVGRFDPQLARWVAACQRLKPENEGRDAYDGKHFSGGHDEVTCKNCQKKVL